MELTLHLVFPLGKQSRCSRYKATKAGGGLRGAGEPWGTHTRGDTSMGRLLEGLGLWWRSLGDGKVLPRGVLGSSAFMGLGLSSIGAAAVTAVP